MSTGSMATGQAGRDTPQEAIGKVWEKRISNMPRHRDYADMPRMAKMKKRGKHKKGCDQ